nr:DUF4242 domain-containing protein [Rhizobium ruizarguesonis]
MIPRLLVFILVERHLPGITPDQLGAAPCRAKNVTAEMTSQSKPVRYLRSTFVPSEERSFCLFDASSEQDVKEANERAGIPLIRIIEVKQSLPTMLSSAAESLPFASVLVSASASWWSRSAP